MSFFIQCVFSAYNYVISPGLRQLVDIDLSLSVPFGCYGRVAPRTGIALRNGILIGGKGLLLTKTLFSFFIAGVIDADYRGSIRVLVFNLGDEPFTISKGEPIAQIICERICYPGLLEVDSIDTTLTQDSGFVSPSLDSNI